MTWPLLETLDDNERSAVLAAAGRRRFVKDQTVFSEGERADSVHLVAVGHLAVRASTPDGDLTTLNILGPGAWFGELSLLRGQVVGTRSATVVALDAAETLVLTQSAFHALCEQYPRIERLVVALMAERIRELSVNLLEARYVGLDRRVCACLHRLTGIYPTDDSHTVIPLTQEHLAGLVGGARPRVNEVLQRLVADHVVELGRGKIVILDRAGLAREAGL